MTSTKDQGDPQASPVELSVAWGDEIEAAVGTQEDAAASYSSRATHVAAVPVQLLGYDPHRARAVILNTATAGGDTLIVGTFADVQAGTAYPVPPGVSLEVFVQREVWARFPDATTHTPVGVWVESNR